MEPRRPVRLDIAIGWGIILALVVIVVALILAGSSLARPAAPPTCGSTADPWPIVCRPVMPEDLDR